MPLSLLSLFERKVVKRLLYSMILCREAGLVLLGRSKPYVRFTVEASPPSVFYNFRVKPDCVHALERKLNLPPGFRLAKMRFLEEESSACDCVSLNVYRVSGITNAVRAEWSVFVRDPDGETRYMVVEAQSSTLTMDPVNIFERARPVAHSLQGGRLETRVVSFGETSFHARCTLPPEGELLCGVSTREWLKSIDLIYWLNGIGDRTFYDGGMACANIRVVPPESVQVEDSTSWRAFIEPAPYQVLLFPDAIEFVMSPWWNV